MRLAWKFSVSRQARLLAALFLVGCVPLSSPRDVPPSEAVVTARQQIAQSRENTQLLAQRIKQKYKGKETKAAYVKARDLHDAAMGLIPGTPYLIS